MRIYLPQNAQENGYIAAWVASRIEFMAANPDFGPCIAIGVVDEAGNLLAGVVLHDYHPDWGAVSMSHAALTPKWLTKRIISGIMSVPFVQYGVGRVTATTPRKATSACQFLRKFGFRQEGVIRRGLGNDDALVWGLLSEEWDRSRFNLQRGLLNRGQENPIAAAGSRSHRRRKRSGRRKPTDGAVPATAQHGGLAGADRIGHVVG